jgi:glycine oxidase
VAPEKTVAIIGGGIIGATLAWRLAQRGCAVTLFEKARLGGEASWAAAGMLSPGGELEGTDPQKTELFLGSRRQYPRFIEELTREAGVPIDYRDCGALDLAYSGDEWAALVHRAEHQRELGVASRALKAEHVHAFSPHIEAENLVGALFYPDDGIVAPRELMSALGVACRKHGVAIREGTAVEQVETRDTEVVINGEPFSRAVVAAGAWSSSIKVNGSCPLPSSAPVKGHLLSFELPIGACPTIVRHGHIYVFQRGSGQVIAGASVEHVGFDRGVDEAVSQALLDRVRRILPVLEKLSPTDIWTGFRPQSTALQLGRWESSPLFLAYGHFRNGILLAPATAELLSGAMLPAVC